MTETDSLVNSSRKSVELKLNGEYVYVDVVRWSPDLKTVTVVLPSGCEETVATWRICG